MSTPRVDQASLYALVRSTGTLRIISDRLRMSAFHLSSCVCRYHVYKDVWTALAGAVHTEQNRKAEKLYAVAVQKDDLTVLY